MGVSLALFATYFLEHGENTCIMYDENSQAKDLFGRIRLVNGLKALGFFVPLIPAEVEDEAGNALDGPSNRGNISLFVLQQVRISDQVTRNRHGFFSCRLMKP